MLDRSKSSAKSLYRVSCRRTTAACGVARAIIAERASARGRTTGIGTQVKASDHGALRKLNDEGMTIVQYHRRRTLLRQTHVQRAG